MSTWIKFFIGSPQRVVRSFVTTCVLLAILNPPAVAHALRIVAGPLLGMALTLWILGQGFKMILGASTSKSGKK